MAAPLHPPDRRGLGCDAPVGEGLPPESGEPCGERSQTRRLAGGTRMEAFPWMDVGTKIEKVNSLEPAVADLDVEAYRVYRMSGWQ